ncbi:DUF881 domain-containing protein [Effusibacillus lacus]|uniref:DUF881 domain-containing protein n=1 Tax=Effusibacillus lacus TaxID=1348429 RepID=A0A292YQ13_9BACL|nr:DUF881 domain-containing protein [Effusibacillus lacus]TCS75680.1 uncharacterized protein YlxW (UPF0749 family) [Effusibacillus lacus]GAX91001.1 hypothetical protein EFBL_2661 [Effusibacillus lacus]
MGNKTVNRFKFSLFGVSILLGAMLTIQMTSGKGKDSDFGGADIIQVKNALAYESKHQQQLMDQIYKMERKIQEYQASPGDREKVLEKMKEELEKARIEAGLTSLEGNGIRIEIRESSIFPDSRGPHSKEFHIFDHELVYLVNILQANGAKAVAFNNQRIVSSSGIREIGITPGENNVIYPGVMQVNFNAVNYPYVIDAIGNIDKMKGALLTYLGKEFFISKGKELVITEYRDQKKLILPAFSGIPGYRYATEEKAEGAVKP